MDQTVITWHSRKPDIFFRIKIVIGKGRIILRLCADDKSEKITVVFVQPLGLVVFGNTMLQKYQLFVIDAIAVQILQLSKRIDHRFVSLGGQ